MMERMRQLAVVIGAVSLLFAGCGNTTDDNGGGGNGGGGEGGWDGGEVVSCEDAEVATWIDVAPDGGTAYSGNATISKGEVVGWRWNDSNHSVTALGSDSCDDWKKDWFDAGPKSSGNWCFKFQKTDKFWYGCTVGDHCANGMKAWVEVQ